MDIFLEKIVARKKNTKDILIGLGIVIGGFAALFLALTLPYIKLIGPVLGFGILFGMYYFITSRNVEFEYAVTNGDLDIDMIVAQRKRKRILSANCRDFEILARLNSDKFNEDIKSIPRRIEAASEMESPNVYFITLHYKGAKTVVFFEPDTKMIDAFKAYIPRKVFE